MTRDERKLVSHLTAKVPSEQLADILSSVNIEEINSIFEESYKKMAKKPILDCMIEAFNALST